MPQKNARRRNESGRAAFDLPGREYAMTMEPEHLSNEHHPDPAFDEMLDGLVDSTEIPDGLSDRVFRASVAGLPVAPLKFESAPARRINVAFWGRAAMAAAILIACVVGVRVILLGGSTQTTDPSDGDSAQNPTTPAVTTIAHVTTVSSEERLERALWGGRNLAWSDEAASPLERGELDYLLDARHASLDDVMDEVDDVIAQLDS